MSLPEIVSREQWRAAREELLAKEKAATRARDALNAERRGLPMVEVDKEYVFEGGDGKATLLDLFEGRLQLVVYHFMFAPEWDAGCRSCSGFLDQIGHLAHLRARGTTFVAVSRAPYTKILPFKARMGWTVPWYSSYGSDFNHDFDVTLEREGELVERPGVSCFLRDGTGSSTPTRRMSAASTDSARPPASSISPRWAGRRSGRSPRGARRRSGRRRAASASGITTSTRTDTFGSADDRTVTGPSQSAVNECQLRLSTATERGVRPLEGVNSNNDAFWRCEGGERANSARTLSRRWAARLVARGGVRASAATGRTARRGGHGPGDGHVPGDRAGGWGGRRGRREAAGVAGGESQVGTSARLRGGHRRRELLRLERVQLRVDAAARQKLVRACRTPRAGPGRGRAKPAFTTARGAEGGRSQRADRKSPPARQVLGGTQRAWRGAVAALCRCGSAGLRDAEGGQGVVDALIEELVGELPVGQGAGELQGSDHWRRR